MQRVLARYHDELDVGAEARELTVAADRTVQFLQNPSGARINRCTADALGASRGERERGESRRTKFRRRIPPTRVAALRVRDRKGGKLFESGALNPDGSIQGNDNDADPARFEPHIHADSPAPTGQIYESILGDWLAP